MIRANVLTGRVRIWMIRDEPGRVSWYPPPGPQGYLIEDHDRITGEFAIAPEPPTLDLTHDQAVALRDALNAKLGERWKP